MVYVRAHGDGLQIFFYSSHTDKNTHGRKPTNRSMFHSELVAQIEKRKKRKHPDREPGHDVYVQESAINHQLKL